MFLSPIFLTKGLLQGQRNLTCLHQVQEFKDCSAEGINYLMAPGKIAGITAPQIRGCGTAASLVACVG